MKGTRIKIDYPGVMRALRKSTIPRAVRCAVLVEREAKLRLSIGAFSGRGPRGGKIMVPSAPGKAPHLRTGELRSSVAHAATKKGAVVGPTIGYGKVHEYGLGKMPKRPFMRPSVLAVRRRFPVQFRNLHLARARRGLL